MLPAIVFPTALYIAAYRLWDLHAILCEHFVTQHRLCGADTAPLIETGRVHDTWSKTGRCQLCTPALQNILQQMAKLNDQDPEYVLKSAHFIFLCVSAGRAVDSQP